MKNHYLAAYINHFIKAFRHYNNDVFQFTFCGLKPFLKNTDSDFYSFLDALTEHGIHIYITGDINILSTVEILCENRTSQNQSKESYRIQDIPSLIQQSAEAGISLSSLIVAKSVGRILCGKKTLYKAIVLDLDDTLWQGTLAEVGVEQIIENLKSVNGTPFIAFMNYVRRLAEDLGIFVAICSRNDISMVQATIDCLDLEYFPIKDQIDYIIANDNPKSDNISLIAQNLSILPRSIVFIDDNKIVRDEVSQHIDGIFAPEWNNHNQLISILNFSCCFERNSLSIQAQRKRQNFKIIQAERASNCLIDYPVKSNIDTGHARALELYAKSNQFNFSQTNDHFGEMAVSLYYDIYRPDGELLDTCATLTYEEDEQRIVVLNWAMSCRYFEIGVEEMILLHLNEIARGKKVQIKFRDSGENRKVTSLLTHYPKVFSIDGDAGLVEVKFDSYNICLLQSNTNLKRN